MNGVSRLIGDTYADKLLITTLSAPATSNGTTYGVGNADQVLVSNGTSSYWGTTTHQKSITLSINSWSNSDPYTQTVILNGTTSTTKVDLLPDVNTINLLINDGVLSLYIKNDNGTLTAYAIGAKPSVTLTILCTTTEVS